MQTTRQPGIPGILFCAICGLDVAKARRILYDYDGRPHTETCEGRPKQKEG